MKNFLRIPFLSLALAAALPGCSSIGDGNTVQTMKIVFSPEARDQAIVVPANADPGIPAEHLRAFDCFCSNVTLLGTFTDGTVANFNSRAHWASSDESKLKVANYEDFASSTTPFGNCPLAQHGAGMVMPVAPTDPGAPVFVTATFLGRTVSYPIEIVDTATAAGSSLTLAPYDSTNTGQVAVGALLPLAVTATLDGRPRNLNLNATFAINPPQVTVGTIDSAGRVAGLSADHGMPLTAQASFGTCNDFTASAQIRVGEPTTLTISPEPNFDSDSMLAQFSSELLKIVADLDFGGGSPSTGTMDVSTQSSVDYTDTCMAVDYDPATAGCSTPAVKTDCASTMPVCASTTTCASGMAECRTTPAPMLASLNRIVAITPYGTPTSFFAKYPASAAVATTIPAALATSSPGATDSVTAAALVNYPAVVPWEAVIDKGLPTEEVVQVTARDTTNAPLVMTVIRGFGGTPTFAHAAGATFQLLQRKTGNTVGIQSVAGSLTSFTLDPAPTATPLPLPLYGSVQLDANGTFTDTTTTPSTTRTQHIAHLSSFTAGTPTAIWMSSKPAIASVSAGLVHSLSPCGGTVVIRLLTRTSSDTTAQADDSFATNKTAAGYVDTNPANGNDDANDAACDADLFCDQMNIKIDPPATLPPGYTADYCASLQ